MRRRHSSGRNSRALVARFAGTGEIGGRREACAPCLRDRLVGNVLDVAAVLIEGADLILVEVEIDEAKADFAEAKHWG